MTDRMEKTAGTEKLQTTNMVRSRLKSADALKQIKEMTLAQIGHRFDADVESGAKLYLMVCGGGGCHSSGSGKLIAGCARWDAGGDCRRADGLLRSLLRGSDFSCTAGGYDVHQGIGG